uniref:Uncharacterized protein n=1 Tax=Strigamia maritima TaxID=126957 RepID=T1IWU4_STRMM
MAIEAAYAVSAILISYLRTVFKAESLFWCGLGFRLRLEKCCLPDVKIKQKSPNWSILSCDYDRMKLPTKREVI